MPELIRPHHPAIGASILESTMEDRYMKNGDMPAMPIHLTQAAVDAMRVANNGGNKDGLMAAFGMTKREQFAMAAMQGILANDSANLINPEIQKIVSRLSVLCADALLEELELSK